MQKGFLMFLCFVFGFFFFEAQMLLIDFDVKKIFVWILFPQRRIFKRGKEVKMKNQNASHKKKKKKKNERIPRLN